jgi:RNA polymerase sigma factor (sigma-70 family)
MTLARNSDHQLLTRADGEPEAFAAFYRRHERSVVAFHGRFCRNAELTIDLTAETFARAYTGRAQFDPGRGTARGWLLGIARHVLAASLERGRVETEAREQLRMHAIQISDHTVRSVEQAVLESGDAVLEQWLSDMPESERDAIRRRVLDEASYTQIAAELGCSEAVVRQRVSRGLSRLRRTAMEAP